MEARKVLVLNDLHAPYNHKKRTSLVVQIAEKLQIHDLILNGDTFDFNNISKYGKNLALSESFKDEVDYCRNLLHGINAKLPNARKTILIGNHENRLNTFISEKCPQFYDIVTLNGLMGFTKNGFKVIDYVAGQAHHITCDLYARHEPPPGVMTGLAGKSFVSLLCGHTHRIYQTNARGLDGKVRRIYGVGHLANSASPALGYLKFIEQWLPGFAVVYDFGSHYFVENVEILTVGNREICKVGNHYYEI